MIQTLKQFKNASRDRSRYLEENGGNLLFINALINTIQFTPNSKILDIGCGTGTLGQYLSFHAEIIGTEKSRKRSKIANQKIQCLYCAGETIPSKIGPFDLIYCKEVLPSINNKLIFFKTIRNRLRAEGKFCTYLPDKNDIIKKPLYRFLPYDLESSIKRYGSVETNVKLLKEAGFSQVRTMRIPLGNVWLNPDYANKHRDGFFSNADKKYMKERILGLNNMITMINALMDYGISIHYDFERTLLIAQ